MKYRHFEAAVGCLTVAVVTVALVYAVIFIVGLWHSRGYVVYADFTSAAGVKVGDPVRISGVQIGEVESINLRRSKARLGIRISKNIELRRDAIASVETRSVLTGDKLIHIEPGDSQEALHAPELATTTNPAHDFTDVIAKLMTSDSDLGL